MRTNALDGKLRTPAIPLLAYISPRNVTGGTTDTNTTFLNELLENKPYKPKAQIPYDWIIRINNEYSLLTMSNYNHQEIIGSFYLPKTYGVPFF